MMGHSAESGRRQRRQRQQGQRLSMRVVGTVLVTVAAMLLQACDEDQGPDAIVHVVEVTPQQATVLVGDTIELSARAKAADGTVRSGVSLAWSTSHPELVAVTGAGGTGRVVALKAGMAEVSAGAHGKIGLAAVEVHNRVPAVTTLQPAAALAGGQAFTLVVTGTGFAANAQVSWNGQVRPTQHVSAQELRAEIQSTDIALPGAVQVGVENPLPGGGVATREFTVATPGPVAVDVQPGTATVTAGQSVTLTATARDIFGNDTGMLSTWSSGNPAVATVSVAGQVTGVAAGVAVIAATTGGVTGHAVVTVTAPLATVPAIASITPDSVDSNPDGLEIVIRGTGFTPASGAFLNSSSRPTEYVSATELKMHLWPGDLKTSGTREVKVFNPGAGGGSSAGEQLRIAPGVWSVRIEPTAGISLWPGQEQQATATAYDEQNRPLTGRAVTWRSNDPSIATVDQTGRVRAVGPGYTAIEAVVGGRMGLRGVAVHETLPWDLLYEGTHGDYPELWLLTLGPDAAPRRILPAGTYGADPAASPDGSRIAFVGISGEGARNIFVVNRNGTGLRQLTSHSSVDDQPAWSRDGTRIAFRSMREGVSDIFVVNADGTGLTNVTRNVERGADGPKAAERPTWTPAGRIVFTYGFALLNPLQYHLVSVQPDGSNWQALTDGYLRDYEPEVSPNGNLIALRRAHPQYGEFIDVIAANGSQLGWISLPGPGNTPSWSPDGAWLTFSHSAAPGQSSIFIGKLNAGQRVVVPVGGRNPVWIRRN
jgi:uncharacterized protein YjdB